MCRPLCDGRLWGIYTFIGSLKLYSPMESTQHHLEHGSRGGYAGLLESRTVGQSTTLVKTETSP